MEEVEIIELDGFKFRKLKSGYYRCNKIIYHRYIWEKENGKIPEGYDIHHKDYKLNGKSNNSIANLQCLSKSDHIKLHANNRSEKTLKLMSESRKGMIFSNEHKSNMAKAGKGNSNAKGHTLSEEAKSKISKANKGNSYASGKRSDEARKKMSDSHLGKKLSVETRNKMKGRGARKVKCLETGTIYSSIKEAAIACSLKSSSGITNCCRGVTKTSGGYHWAYA